MDVLITGGCGFLGSNLTRHALENGLEVAVIDNLERAGSQKNLNWLREFKNFKHYSVDISDYDNVLNIFKLHKPRNIFHLAGQVAMTTSIANPMRDHQVNVVGTLNILEGMRIHSPDARIIYSSTNKVYGDLEGLAYCENDTRYTSINHPNGFDTDLPLCFSSPYGCSKGAADQYVLDYANTYDLDTVVLRHSSMYGGRQFATVDQGWLGWFTQCALRTLKEPSFNFTISGNGKQVRDLLHARDITELYFSIFDHAEKLNGKVYNVGGGIENSMSILELLDLLNKKLKITTNHHSIAARKSDQKFFVSENNQLLKEFSWSPRISADEGIDRMIKWIRG